MTIIEVAVIAGMKRSSNMTVATIAPTEELEGDVTLLDGFTDSDIDGFTDSDTKLLDGFTDSDTDVVTVPEAVTVATKIR